MDGQSAGEEGASSADSTAAAGTSATSSSPGTDTTFDTTDATSEPPESAGVYAQELLAGQLSRTALPLGLLLAAGIFFGVRDGFRGLEPIVLIVGALGSAVAMFLYALPSVLVAHGREPRPWMALAALFGLVPYLFGVAVIFAIGMVRPLVVFSLTGAVEAVFFLVVGFWFLRDYSRMTALGKRIDDVMEA